MFFKEIPKGEKKLFHIKEVNFIKVPNNPELSVRNIMIQIKNQECLKPHLPQNYEKKRKISRDWLMNVINTVIPGYLEKIIASS